LVKRELRTFEEFRQARLDDKGFIVITDVTRPAIAHKLNGRCISADNFKSKMVLDGGGTGKYYWVDNFQSAALEFGASACRLCKPLRPEKDIWKS
jgi:hypothetical protein